MKIMIASDIHGSAYFCEKLMDAYQRETPERFVLLGDLLYHGPRNDLPRDYAPKKVIQMLNERKEQLLCVRGNCDTEVDQMVLDFPILADYCVLFDGKQVIYATHGHKYNEENLPPIAKGGILLQGHTHVPGVYQRKGYIFMNPGSVSIPKEGSWHGYMMLEDGVYTWKNLEGKQQLIFPIS